MASLLFGTTVLPESVIGETLRRATEPIDDTDPAGQAALRERVAAAAPSTDYDEFVRDPLSRWIEAAFGIEEREGRLVRVAPQPIAGPAGGAQRLADHIGADVSRCETAIRGQLLGGYRVEHPDTKFPAFAFLLHTFISKGAILYALLAAHADSPIQPSGRRDLPHHQHSTPVPLLLSRHAHSTSSNR